MYPQAFRGSRRFGLDDPIQLNARSVEGVARVDVSAGIQRVSAEQGRSPVPPDPRGPVCLAGLRLGLAHATTSSSGIMSPITNDALGPLPKKRSPVQPPFAVKSAMIAATRAVLAARILA